MNSKVKRLQDLTLEQSLGAGIILLSLFDGASTYIGMVKYGLKEQNIIVNNLIKVLNPEIAILSIPMVSTMVIFSLFYLYKYRNIPDRLFKWTLILLFIWNVFIVINNTYVLSQQKDLEIKLIIWFLDF